MATQHYSRRNVRPRSTWILVTLALGLFAFIYFFEARIKPPAAPVTLVLPGLDATEVTSLQILLHDGDKIRVECSNGVWRLVEPVVSAVKPGVVEKFLQSLGQLTMQTRITAEELKNHHGVGQEYGLDNPQFTIVAQQGGQEHRLKLGSRTEPGDQLYAQVVSSTEGIDIISADFLKSVPQTADDWRDRTFASLAGVDFDVVKVTGAMPFELQHDRSNNLWSLGGSRSARADNSKVTKALGLLQNLRVNQFVTDDAHGNFAPYGLRPPQLELTFTQGTNPVLSLQFGLVPSNQPSQIYARIADKDSVVMVSSDALADWRSGADTFRELHLVDAGAFLSDTLEVSGRDGQESFTVQWPTNGVQVIDAQKQVYPGDLNALREFMSVLTGITIVNRDGRLQQTVVESQQAEFGLGTNPVRRYTLKRTPATNPGATNTVIIAQADFGIMTNGIVYARRSDLTNESSYIYETASNSFMLLPRTALDFRDRRVWNFAPSNINNITFRINGTNKTWSHMEENKWRPVAGITYVSRPGDNMDQQAAAGAELLGELAVRRWVERAPQDRARYGFSEKDFRITVEVKEVKEGSPPSGRARTIEVGDQAGPGRYYAAVTMDVDGKEWIGELSADDLQHLVGWFMLNQSP